MSNRFLDLEEINFKTVSDPAGFVRECDEMYNANVRKAAELIAENRKKSPIVLLAGPSGSGKTTTSGKISEALERMGIKTHYIAMDDYFITVSPETTPRTPEGDYDFESPLCLDMELLNKHFTALQNGETIEVPRYDFPTQSRAADISKTVMLGDDELAIFEGIHALNSMFTQQHPEAFKLYISARSNVAFKGEMVFKGTWFRLARRMVRDYNFRGYAPDSTLKMWANVRRGEKAYISPFKDSADFQFDTVIPYEAAVYNRIATKLFSEIPEGIERYEELRMVFPALQLFGEIDEKYVPEDALIREFIGNGNK